MNPSLNVSDHSEDNTLDENDFMFGNFDEGANCSQNRWSDTSQTKRKHTSKSFYMDIMSRIVNACEAISMNLNRLNILPCLRSLCCLIQHPAYTMT